MEWYEKWFNNLYLQLYSHRNEIDAKNQIKLIQKSIKLDKRFKILDLACGEGRHCKILSDLGYDVYGIDLSSYLINSGKKKYPELNLNIGDMRNIEGSYNLILSLFTSFGYFEKDEENQQVINSVSKALMPNGYYWLDFLNPFYLEKNLVKENEKVLENNITVFEKRKIENGFVIKTIEFSTGEKFNEKVKLYNKDYLVKMFEIANIKPIEIFGNYHGKIFEENDMRTIIYGRKI